MLSIRIPFIILLTAFAAATLFTACSHDDKGSTDRDPAPKDSASSPKYQIGEVAEGRLGSTANLPAVLKPFERVDIYPKVNGFIKDIPVDRGSEVHTGQLLVRLEAPEIEQQFYSAKAKYLQVYSLYLASKDDYDRLVVANRLPGTVSAHDLELAHAKMVADSASAQGEIANYRALEATSGYLRVTAPFNGVITERNVHPGALVGPAQKAEDRPMLVLEQQNKLRLVIDVPEVYSNQLSGHSLVRFHVSTLPGKTFQGTISRSAGSLNMKYRSEPIEVDVNNADRLLKPGMFAEVELPVSRNTNSLIVPASAVVTSQEKQYVICIQGDKAHWMDVTKGNSRHDSIEVFGDLHPHDHIIINANDEIKDGAIIR
ncbi:MAG: efflux RND transporter periplasmic adaptor subunit [Bacteroidota bacterium]|nr:efflux RND transporter periplasmic adaptor subunit [Bacteroidota bacterium]MDP4215234.1 efflux RND transporter periplasmic adaptor subunit [Bacteroidota bacterium]MDP4247286.1 efflux RND transporter periplasmic adaptor subunit [Bacteroidota bacterium]MDP4257925.1 efflux RND transporter periplasmic adaptor subunit [Bacteroidota bacterium]